MERDLNPNPNPNHWYNNNTTNSYSQWEYTTTNNLIPIPPLIPPPLIPHQNNNSNSPLFPTFTNNPYGYEFTPFPLYPNPVQFPYNSIPPPLYNFPAIIPNPPHLMNINPTINPTITDTITGTVNGTIDGTIDDGTESEMEEDSEEIDALLYSDSDEYNNDDYDNNNNDEFEMDSPVIITGEEVASTSIHPKKRRLGTDFDDTASSAKCYKNNGDDLEFSDAESSCVGEEEEEEGMSEKLDDCTDLQLKRKRIQETVGLLRRIIPGGKGKDAATILDEAICYLKSLKLKARALGTR